MEDDSFSEGFLIGGGHALVHDDFIALHHFFMRQQQLIAQLPIVRDQQQPFCILVQSSHRIETRSAVGRVDQIDDGAVAFIGYRRHNASRFVQHIVDIGAIRQRFPRNNDRL